MNGVACFVEDGLEPGEIRRRHAYREQVVRQFAVLNACSVPVLDELFCGAREATSGRGEFGARLALAAGDELAFKLSFKATHVVDERGARREQLLGCNRPIEFLGEYQELLQILRVHRASPRLRRCDIPLL